MRMETFIRKSLRLKAHMVTEIQEREAEQSLVVHVERLGQRRLRCGECRRQASRVAPTRRPVRRWRDLAMREHIVELVYAPYRVWCVHCGLRVERIPWLGGHMATGHPFALPRCRGAGPTDGLECGRPALPPELEDRRGGCRGRGPVGTATSPLAAPALARAR